MKRRTFLATSAAAAQVQLTPNVTRHWIGPEYFANRYQDWRLHDGRIECLNEEGLRTVAILTQTVEEHTSGAVELQVSTGGEGFSGFLIGAGAGELDWRAAALVQGASGEGGGLLCVRESDGTLSFREHTSESQPLAYARRKSESSGAGAGEVLKLRIQMEGDGRATLTLESGSQTATLRRVDRKLVTGGILLAAKGRCWFRDFSARGTASHPERTFGPILGAMFSVNRDVLRMSAQFAPLGEGGAVTLEVRPAGGAWQRAAQAQIEAGFVARFRKTGWDSSKDHEYRIRFGEAVYSGRIPRDPGTSRTLKIGFINCVMPVWRTLDGGAFQPTIPGEAHLGRYTRQNIYFPHSELVRNMQGQQPDFLAFLGDQIYEGNPTRKDSSENPALDYLYKWTFWVWTFRDLTRNTPSVMLVDDHDVYQGNVWGQGGRRAPDRVQEAGGYTCNADFVNLVQRTQTSHNPDPFDATPIEQGIGVYYCAFEYGGVQFAMVEDRKFKTGPQSKEPGEKQLLGARQEGFLEKWGQRPRNNSPRICFSQTVFACVQTSPEGGPRNDSDSNGTPKPKRDRAVKLLREAGALLIAGDQHLASVVLHDGEGPVQFTGPGGGTSFQRWFEPSQPLDNARGRHTGDWTDGFGNKFRVLAIANPKVSFEQYRQYKPPRGQGLGDRSLKSEGYGIVQVNHERKFYTLECWDFEGQQQFEGWPILVGFDGKILS